MDDSNKPNTYKNQPSYSLGMSSFTNKERAQFGHKLRLAMACIEAPPEPVKDKAIPDDKAYIRQRLKSLSQDMTSQHADLLALLVKFDDLEGWKTSGARHCAAWMNVEIGISLQLSWEYLRVGRKLQLLPTLNALFRAGKLSWSKVRLISRVADQDSEPLLCHAALDTSVSDVKRICDTYRWGEEGSSENNIKDENDRALQQWDSRSLTWSETSNGSTLIQLVLPPEIAQAFLNSVEYSMNQLDDTASKLSNRESKMSQRRADAAVLMAENSLQSAGKAIATADRYQVIVSVDAAELSINESGHRQADRNSEHNSIDTSTNNPVIPTKRPTLCDAGPIARETAKRITCDCSLSINKTINGEPVDIGRKSRVWPTAMERAIKERDKQCIWPGCTQSRHLHIHHITHWADGGATSVSNGVCLCSHHHTLVHEGGYAVQHVDDNTQRLLEQFVQQQHAKDSNLLNFESALRNSRESFNLVRKLSPTQYRFRIIDSQGKDILDRSFANIAETKQWPDSKSHYPNQSCDSTRISCGEPKPNGYYSDIYDSNSKLLTNETIPNYILTAQVDNNSVLDTGFG